MNYCQLENPVDPLTSEDLSKWHFVTAEQPCCWLHNEGNTVPMSGTNLTRQILVEIASLHKTGHFVHHHVAFQLSNNS